MRLVPNSFLAKSSKSITCRQTVRRTFASHSNLVNLDGSLQPSIVSGSVPGPKGIAASKAISEFQDERTHVLVCGR